MFKKLIRSLALGLAFLAAPTAGAFTVDGLNYSVSSGEATLTGATSKTITSLTVPATVTYNGTTYPVNFIAHNAFDNYSNLKSVRIEDSDHYIGSTSYINSSGYTTWSSPFENCPIEEYYLGRNQAFKVGDGVRVDYLQLASTAESISVTFAGGTNYIINCKAFNPIFTTKLTTLTLGGNIKDIYSSAFQDCTVLKHLVLLEGQYSLSGWMFPQNYSIDNIEIKALWSSFPGDINVNTVKIGDAYKEIPRNYMQFNKNVRNIVLPETIESIGAAAFYNCVNLENVSYPSSLKNIGNSAFDGCSKLATPRFGNNLEGIGSYAFSGCQKITEISIPGSVKKIGQYAFSNTKPETITFESSVANDTLFFSTPAFNSGTVGLMTLNRLVESTEDTPFRFGECCPVEAVFGEAWKEIPHHFFQFNRSLKKIVFPETLEKIDVAAFYNCDILETVNYPTNLKRIAGSAFAECRKLTTPDFNKNLEEIRTHAFNNCAGIQAITIPGSVKHIGEYAFGGTHPKTITFESSEVNDTLLYSRTAFSVGTLDQMTLNRLVDIIEENDFRFDNCAPIEVVFGEAWKEIPEHFFQYNKSLKKIVFPETLEKIQFAAFFNCNNLETVSLPESLKTIGKSAFYDCTSLKSLSFGKNVTLIGASAFNGASNLSEIVAGAKIPPVCENNNSFSSGIYPTAKVVVPTGAKRAYKNAEVWKKFYNIESEGALLVTVEYDKDGGTVTLNGRNVGSLELDEGESLDVVMTPAKGFMLKDVYSDNASVLDKVVDNKLHYDEVSDTLRLVVDFAPIMFKVTANPNIKGGKVEVNGGNETVTEVQYGSRLELKPVADEGYALKTFMVNGQSAVLNSEGVYVIESVEEDIDIDAEFDLIKFKAVAIYDNTMGTVGLNGVMDSTIIDYGKNLTVVVKPVEGHFVESATVNGETIEIVPQGFTKVIEKVTADVKVEVKFDIFCYSVVAEYDGEMGNVTVNGNEGSDSVAWNTDAVVSIVPAYGYQIASVELDGLDVTSDVDAEGLLTIKAVKANHVLKVAFEVKRVRLSVAGLEGGVLTTVHDFGTEVTYLPEAEEGWKFHSATVGSLVIEQLNADGSFVTGPLTEDTKVTVVFEKKEGRVGEESFVSNVKVTARRHSVIIEGAFEDSLAEIFDMSGVRQYSGLDRTITIDTTGVYIVTIEGRTFKVLLR